MHKKTRQRGSTYVQHMVQRNNLQGHLGHDDNMIIWKGVDSRNINTASPEYIAFHSIQCRSRVTQIFFLFLFYFLDNSEERRSQPRFVLAMGKQKTHKKTKQMQNDSWCRIRKVLTWGHAENIRGARPKLAKRLKWRFAADDSLRFIWSPLGSRFTCTGPSHQR